MATAVDFDLIAVAPPEPWAVDFEADAGQTSGTSAGSSSDSATATVRVALSGTSAGLSSDMAEADGLAGAVTGTSPGTSADSGEVDQYLEGAVESPGTSSDSGVLTLTAALTGTSAGTSADGATVGADAVASLTGTSPGTSSDTATAIGGVTAPLSGTSAGASSDTAQASGVGDVAQPLTGTSAGTSADSLDAPALSASLTGASHGSALDSATARLHAALSGTSPGTSSDSGTTALATDAYLSGRYTLTLAESRTICMQDTFYIKRGDRWPALEATLAKKGGGSLGFTDDDISAVKLLMARANVSTLTVDAEVSSYSVNGAGTELSITYEWGEGETDTAGHYRAEVEVTLVDGSRATFPNDDYITVVIKRDLG